MSPFWKRGSKPAPHPRDIDRLEDEDKAPEEQKQEDASKDDPNIWHTEAVESLSPKPVWQEEVLCRGQNLASLQPLMALKGAAPRAMHMRAAAPMAAMACAAMPVGAPAASGAGIGFKTGGAQDVANFRENISAGKLPLPSDVTFEGLCKEYYFDTSSSDAQPTTELFAPIYSLALAPDPLLASTPASGSPASSSPAAAAVAGAGASGGPAAERATPFLQQAQQAQQQAQQAQQQQDVFLAVGLDSGLTDFKRPRLNLAILLDVSGSMDSRFDEYYYDPASGERRRLADGEVRKTKLDVAKEVMKGMLDRLAPDDMVSISLFSDATSTPKLLGRWGDADAAGIKAGIDALHTVGCTNFQAGLDEAAAQLRRAAVVVDSDPATTENRIVVLTDAQPNAGEISETGLLSRLKASASDRIYCTLVGVGLDFNSDLVEKILKCRGANYLSVHTPGEFRQRLDDEFDFMVAPLVFDLELRIDPASLATPTAAASTSSGSSSGSSVTGWRVAHVYGSPDSEERRLSGGGSIMRVHSLFPSPKTEEGIKGGVVLLRLAPPAGAPLAAAPPLRLEARYQDRSGKQYSTLRTVAVPAEAADVAASEAEGPTTLYQSTGVRKAVLLARLTDALQGWLVDQWAAGEPGGAPGPNSWNAAAVQEDGLDVSSSDLLRDLRELELELMQQPAGGAASTRLGPEGEQAELDALVAEMTGETSAPPMQEILGQPAPPAPEPAPAPQPRDPALLHLRPGCPLLPPGEEAVERCKPPLETRRWSHLERQSHPLAVGPEARAAFRQLLPWVESEIAALGDDSLGQEAALLRTLAGRDS